MRDIPSTKCVQHTMYSPPPYSVSNLQGFICKYNIFTATPPIAQVSVHLFNVKYLTYSYNGNVFKVILCASEFLF